MVRPEPRGRAARRGLPRRPDRRAGRTSGAPPTCSNSQQEAVAAALHRAGHTTSPRASSVGSTQGGVARRRRARRRATRSSRVDGETVHDITELRAAIAANGTSKPLSCGSTRSARPRRRRSPRPRSPRRDADGAVVGVDVRVLRLPLRRDDPAAGRRRPERRHDVRARHHRQAHARRAHRRRARRGTGTIAADGDGRADRRHPAEDVRRPRRRRDWFLAPASQLRRGRRPRPGRLTCSRSTRSTTRSRHSRPIADGGAPPTSPLHLLSGAAFSQASRP